MRLCWDAWHPARGPWIKMFEVDFTELHSPNAAALDYRNW